ncbi:hypothetical protein ADICYQ_4874 [Cyclobacterium qasimii M12-11B]|uniref:Uncharacterized protein n=1 Tax=Cyclobacterium qasimii M12-11B TaxID=641524 RepID=S7V8G0_9BACT|nr:hypothetical protein ADICYQ_4874 [Cyclobacterium qasimii M12-11B]
MVACLGKPREGNMGKLIQSSMISINREPRFEMFIAFSENADTLDRIITAFFLSKSKVKEEV